jgi:hypothetical protein
LLFTPVDLSKEDDVRVFLLGFCNGLFPELLRGTTVAPTVEIFAPLVLEEVIEDNHRHVATHSVRQRGDFHDDTFQVGSGIVVPVVPLGGVLPKACS